MIGLGRIGKPICTRLVQGGFEVTAGDRRAELKPEMVALGARWGASFKAVAADADVLVTVLPGPLEVRDALLGPEGAFAALRAGATWIDMSSCDPAAGRAVAAVARAKGVRCLDAPLGGNPAAARDGRLQFFVGGDRGDVEVQRPLLETLAEPDAIRHVGDHGAGYLTKLLVNLLWFGQALATAEALLLASSQGLDLDVLREALAGSAASTHFIRCNLDALMDGDYLPSFPLDRCCEELQAVIQLAKQSHIPHELAGTVSSIYLRALERYGPADGELLSVALLEDEAQVRIRHGGE